MITLLALDPHWLDTDSRDDQCAHGDVLFEVDGVSLVSPADGNVNLSAAALLLLRTLDHENTAEAPLSACQLFPCCGFNVWDCGQRFRVWILGCPGGVDVEIRHDGGDVIFRRGGSRATASHAEWSATVLGFVAAIERFYGTSPPKKAIEDPEDARGWAAFWSEWRQRVDAHRPGIVAMRSGGREAMEGGSSMEHLLFVDEHSEPIAISDDLVWTALLKVVRHGMVGSGQLARILGCDPAKGSAAFAGRPGEAVPGVRVLAVEPGRRLVLRGRHRFADYALTFVLDGDRLRAQTHAAFPGLRGRLYRAAVIGSGAHRIVTRRLLRQVVRAARPSA